MTIYDGASLSVHVGDLNHKTDYNIIGRGFLILGHPGYTYHDFQATVSLGKNIVCYCYALDRVLICNALILKAIYKANNCGALVTVTIG